MGWYYDYGASKADTIKTVTKDWDNKNGSKGRCLAKCLRGNVLWTVFEVTDPDGQPHRHIGCYLLQSYEGDWGYKPMDESVGPFYYSCPLSYLDMVPVANEDWRESVRKYHSKETDGRNIVRNLNIGDTVALREGFRPNKFRLVSKKPLLGIGPDGRTYKLRTKTIDADETKRLKVD